MSYSAKVFNVMIASPGDVSAERGIIRNTIYEWNAIHSMSRNIVLLPVGWESHVPPEMGSHPQEIINRQILGKCDLLIGVFWTRIGTKTDNFSSGSVEEIEKHIDAGKPTMLYFSSQPVSLDTVDPVQVQKLREFKESCISRGIYKTYDSLAEFKDKLNSDIQLTMNQPDFTSSTNTEGDAELQQQTRIPQLTEEAKAILIETSNDPNGTIILFRTMRKHTLQVNQHNLIQSEDRREVAKWEAAMEVLKEEKLIVPRGTKGEIFEITALGYDIVEYIK